MPCSDGGYSSDQLANMRRAEERKERDAQIVIASLCAICAVLESQSINLLPQVLDMVNWEEAGIKRTEFAVWWDRHKEEDRQRREAEEQAKRKANKRASARAAALAKLSPADRKALGL